MSRAPWPLSALDHLLTAQLAVAWAGETGKPTRLGWWRTELVFADGGLDLFAQLTPRTAEWAVLQAVREAARRQDATLRARHHDPDRLITLFRHGFELDERLDERLATLKATAPHEALPALAHVTAHPWSRATFLQWIQGHGATATTAAPAGRRIEGPPPADLVLRTDRLVAALDPLSDHYPLPHYER